MAVPPARQGSGLDIPHEFGVVFTFQSGRVVRVAVFPSRDEALRAAGLES